MRGRRPAVKPKPDLEAIFEQQLKGMRITGYVREHVFHSTRKWRLDFAFVVPQIAVEIEGGTWSLSKTGHTSGSGFNKDCHKYNELALLGWTLLRGDEKMVRSLELLKYLERALLIK